jgi:hypothetical protein
MNEGPLWAVMKGGVNVSVVSDIDNVKILS